MIVENIIQINSGITINVDVSVKFNKTSFYAKKYVANISACPNGLIFVDSPSIRYRNPSPKFFDISSVRESTWKRKANRRGKEDIDST